MSNRHSLEIIEDNKTTKNHNHENINLNQHQKEISLNANSKIKKNNISKDYNENKISNSSYYNKENNDNDFQIDNYNIDNNMNKKLFDKTDWIEYKNFSLTLSIICLIFNIFLPGIGTIIGIYGMNEKKIKKSFICTGICQVISSFCFVGWCYAQCTSCFYIAAANYGKSFEEFIQFENIRNDKS